MVRQVSRTGDSSTLDWRVPGSAGEPPRGGQLIRAIVIGNLAYATLIAFAMGRRGTSFSIGEGAKVGALVGFLVWCTVDFIFYGTTNVANQTRTVVDPLLEIVHGGLGGAAIGAVLRQLPAPATVPA